MEQEDLSAEKTQELMGFVLNHYINHHQVVLKKLEHAHNATLQSIKELEELCEKLKLDEKSAEYQEVKKYDKMWAEIIGLFRLCGISEDELLKVEDTLVSIPQAIKRYYDSLLKQDKALLAMMAELDFDRYKAACKAIESVQARPNPMSGLMPETYEDNIDSFRQAYLMKAPGKPKKGGKRR